MERFDCKTLKVGDTVVLDAWGEIVVDRVRGVTTRRIYLTLSDYNYDIKTGGILCGSGPGKEMVDLGKRIIGLADAEQAKDLDAYLYECSIHREFRAISNRSDFKELEAAVIAVRKLNEREEK